ncbi:MAG TPA: hypothetical protein V6C86_02125 [Oculatellaceae cyanobacterium]
MRSFHPAERIKAAAQNDTNNSTETAANSGTKVKAVYIPPVYFMSKKSLQILQCGIYTTIKRESARPSDLVRTWAAPKWWHFAFTNFAGQTLSTTVSVSESVR